MKVKGYAALAPKQALECFDYEPKKLDEHEIEVAITHCGICHSDLHLIDNDWGVSSYPLIPGHEIVGNVSAIGTAVTHLQVGQRVGVSWQCGACMICEWCLSGNHNFCASEQPICIDHFGGFADKVQVDGRFAFLLPETLDSAQAAPLLCAGATVYSALIKYAQPGMRVGIIGIGGLGHLAVQFAHAMGCDVTAFSSSPDKQVEVMKLGASHFKSSTDVNELINLANSFDFLLSTVHVELAWEPIVNMLKPYGKLCLVGIPDKPIQIPTLSLILGNRSICGGNIGNIADINEMLQFAARHNIQAKIEQEPLHRVNEAITRARNNQVRYRIVLTI